MRRPDSAGKAFAVRHFAGTAALVTAAADALAGHLQAEGGTPRAVLLSGGETPMPVYREVAERGVRADEGVVVILGDERMVPEDSAESNYGRIRPLLAAWGIPESRVLRPQPATGLRAAAERFDGDLRLFFKTGGRVMLGFLGLGADGHTASLFSARDVERGGGRYAIAVRPGEGPARVSITPFALARVTSLVVLVAGQARKGAVLQTLLATPERLPAGLALRGHAGVQVWAGWPA